MARLGPKLLIGEMSIGMPASASVILTQPSRLFAVDVKSLNNYLARNLSVRHELESRFVGQVSEKLTRANAAFLAQRTAKTSYAAWSGMRRPTPTARVRLSQSYFSEPVSNVRAIRR